MPDPIVPAAGAVAPDAEVKSFLDGADAEASSQAAAAAAAAKPDAGKSETPEEKTARETEEKRILEADPATLNDADKAKRAPLEAAKEEKRLLETPKDKLSAEDQVKQAALLKAKEDAKAAKGAPEAYADFTVPDGVEVDKEMLDEFKTTAKKLNLTQEAAQELVSLQAKHMTRIAQSLENTFKEITNEWKKDLAKELGADYKKDQGYAIKAIDKLGTPELRKILNETGIGNHKELVKFFVRVGKLVSEDSLVPGSSGADGKSDAEKFYGNTMK